MNKGLVVIFSLLLLLGITNAIQIHLKGKHSGPHGSEGERSEHGRPHQESKGHHGRGEEESFGLAELFKEVER